MRGLLVVLALAGCRQVFGLEPPELVAPDGGGALVSGRYVLRYLTNNTQHQPTVVELPLKFTATVKLDDGTEPGVTLLADGAFEFATNTVGQRYRLLLEANGYSPIEFDHTASSLALYEMRAGRLDAVVASANTQLSYQLSDVTAGGAIQLFTTGSYMLSARASEPSVVFDWPGMVTATGGPATLLDADANDRAYLLYLTMTGSTAVLDRYRADDITLTDGMRHSISGPTNIVARDTCVNARILAATEEQRLDDAGYSSPTVAYSAAWGVVVQPSLDVGFQSGALVAQNVLSPASDLELTITVGSPVPGTFLQYLAVKRTFDIAATTGSVIKAAIGTNHVVAVDRTCNTQATLGGSVELPGVPRIDDMRLELDRDIAIDRSHDVTVSWPALVAGKTDVTRVHLLEVTAAGLVVRRQFVTTRDHVSVDANLFENSKSYVVRVSHEVGWTAAKNGDFGTFAPPLANSVRLSAVFRVTN